MSPSMTTGKPTTAKPTRDPTTNPTSYPTADPVIPTEDPTVNPSIQPTLDPTADPVAKSDNETLSALYSVEQEYDLATADKLIDPRQQPVSQLSGYWKLLLLSAAVVVIAAAYSVWRKRSEPYTK